MVLAIEPNVSQTFKAIGPVLLLCLIGPLFFFVFPITNCLNHGDKSLPKAIFSLTTLLFYIHVCIYVLHIYVVPTRGGQRKRDPLESELQTAVSQKSPCRY